jgi:MerR family redox-sensitive transcriptional activator SoxR
LEAAVAQCNPTLDIKHRTSSALEVKQKVAHTGDVDDALTIGEVAARSGVATSALRFYEDQGLIASERTDAGHRRYPRAVLRRVAFIVFAQRVGLSLEDIRAELARLPRNRAPDRADWAKLSTGWAARIDERIAELERMKIGLTACIGCGCLSLDRCRFSNPGDRAARRGAGPRYWIEPEGTRRTKSRT